MLYVNIRILQTMASSLESHVSWAFEAERRILLYTWAPVCVRNRMVVVLGRYLVLPGTSGTYLENWVAAREAYT